ncbi:MAG: pirin family protein [Bacteriovoracaceae bacterium]|jgi:redox-sensitive bicupin YhaK (pirin superfamily)|nr:pirin family protein [Bacteriovoracaceae bacterium]
MKNKKIKFSYQQSNKIWVGDGFNVHPMLRPNLDIIQYINPFILADYASPKKFLASNKPRGIGEHPHRGMETVTLAFQGEIEHADSIGSKGIIKAGDIQWMSAASGIVHKEFHSEEFTKVGGTFEMMQLWINLPAKDKMTSPRYQEIKKENIPTVDISNHTTLRVIAGKYNNTTGPALTFSSINMLDINSFKSDKVHLQFKEDTNTVLLVLSGEVEINNQTFNKASTIIFDRDGFDINMKVSSSFKALLLNGEPINEAVIASGPFVMNSKEEINQAIYDYQTGKMGKL